MKVQPQRCSYRALCHIAHRSSACAAQASTNKSGAMQLVLPHDQQQGKYPQVRAPLYSTKLRCAVLHLHHLYCGCDTHMCHQLQHLTHTCGGCDGHPPATVAQGIHQHSDSIGLSDTSSACITAAAAAATLSYTRASWWCDQANQSVQACPSADREHSLWLLVTATTEVLSAVLRAKHVLLVQQQTCCAWLSGC
jgi:hypothetical protein